MSCQRGIAAGQLTAFKSRCISTRQPCQPFAVDPLKSEGRASSENNQLCNLFPGPPFALAITSAMPRVRGGQPAEGFISVYIKPFAEIFSIYEAHQGDLACEQSSSTVQGCLASCRPHVLPQFLHPPFWQEGICREHVYWKMLIRNR